MDPDNETLPASWEVENEMRDKPNTQAPLYYEIISDTEDEVEALERHAPKRVKLEKVTPERNGFAEAYVAIDVLCVILSYCDFRTLVAFGGTCNEIREIVLRTIGGYIVEATYQSDDMARTLELLGLTHGGCTHIRNANAIRRLPAFDCSPNGHVGIAEALSMRMFFDDMSDRLNPQHRLDPDRLRDRMFTINISFENDNGLPTRTIYKSISEEQLQLALNQIPDPCPILDNFCDIVVRTLPYVRHHMRNRNPTCYQRRM